MLPRISIHPSHTPPKSPFASAQQVTRPTSDPISTTNASSKRPCRMHAASSPIGGDNTNLSPLVVREALWQEVEKTAYQSLPTLQWQYSSLPSLFGLLYRIIWNKELRTTVLEETFVRPEDIRSDREKLFHPFGTVAKVAYEPVATKHPFTGLFASKEPIPALIRLSLATDESNYVPGIALKLFVPHRKSFNIHAIPGLTGQKNKFFFAADATTSLPKANFPARLLEMALETLRDPRHLPLDSWAQVQEDGHTISKPAMPPSRLIFRNNAAKGFGTKDAEGDFRTYLAKWFKPQDELYSVWAVEKEGMEPIRIGRIVMDSNFIASSFGDKRIHFRHASKDM